MKTFRLRIRQFLFAFACTALIIAINSCSDDNSSNPAEEQTIKIAVFSDPHYFDPSLGTSGQAFEMYIASDPKLLAESDAITKSLMNSLIAEKPNFVIVSGDLTKDGEEKSHQSFANYLKSLEANGAKVLVIPGNHDINNPNSYSYSGSTTTKVNNVSPEQFATIYKDFGYSEAMAKDPNSLSYITKASESLWIFAMDVCLYKNNTDHPVTGGAFSNETLTWIITKLQEAKSRNITAIGFMHHGLIEHFTGQKTSPVSAEYVIEDWQNVSSQLAANGMKLVFSGHYHANDITKKTDGNNFVFDAETGSTVSAPCPYRIVSIDPNKKVNIQTKHITSIDYDTDGLTFQDYAAREFQIGMTNMIEYALIYDYGLDQSTAAQLSPAVVGGFAAHYTGDEQLTDENIIGTINYLLNSGDPTQMFLGSSIQSYFTDLPPVDNNIVIDLVTGNITE
jgi:3',5'-cyclic AMP phosphodiesterase CpdA